jgi:AcrR family transcriptional regulator
MLTLKGALIRDSRLELCILTMRAYSGRSDICLWQAARASHMSLGGLYHYFPTKRDLVFYGMDPDAMERSCHEFIARFGHLRESDPVAMIGAFIYFFAEEATFIRPAIKAALSLGADDLLPRFGDVIAIGMPGFTRTPSRALPNATEGELLSLASATRRLFFASLIDWTLTPEAFEEELRALVEGVRARHEAAALA